MGRPSQSGLATTFACLSPAVGAQAHSGDARSPGLPLTRGPLTQLPLQHHPPHQQQTGQPQATKQMCKGQCQRAGPCGAW